MKLSGGQGLYLSTGLHPDLQDLCQARALHFNWKLEPEGQLGAALLMASRWQTCPSQEMEPDLALKWKLNKKKAGPSQAGGPSDPTGSKSEAAASQLCTLDWCQGVPGVRSRPTYFVNHWIHPQKRGCGGNVVTGSHNTRLDQTRKATRIASGLCHTPGSCNSPGWWQGMGIVNRQHLPTFIPIIHSVSTEGQGKDKNSYSWDL